MLNKINEAKGESYSNDTKENHEIKIVECKICCDLMLESQILSCSQCQNKACLTCYQTYIMVHLREPCCMTCKQICTMNFMVENFHSDWLKQIFLPHHGKMVIEREKALLPTRQEQAILASEMKLIRKQIAELPTNVTLKRKYQYQQLEKEITKKQSVRKKLQQKIDELKSRRVLFVGSNIQKLGNKTYISKCVNDSCRGFVDLSHSCGICSQKICKKCHLPNNFKHRCKKENILSATVVKSETKNCPKCFIPIFKIFGCSEMFCTLCHTSFDWETGLVLRGFQHNPHFLEWIVTQEKNRNWDQIEPTEIPFYHEYHNRLNELQVYRMGWKDQCVCTHIYDLYDQTENNILPNFVTNYHPDNSDLGINFLSNEINEINWTMKVLNRDKKQQKQNLFRTLIEDDLVVLADLIRQVMIGKDMLLIINKFYTYEEHRAHRLEKIVSIYGGKIPKIVG